MFEPKTYQEKIGLVYRSLVLRLAQYLPSNHAREIQQEVNQIAQIEQMLKVQEANSILGDVTIPDESRATLLWVRNFLAANLGRTAWNSKLKGATHEGAIGTKTFGQKWRTWLNQLPQAFTDFNDKMPTGFYVDSGQLMARHDLPRLFLIVNTGSQIILFAPIDQNVVSQQVYSSHVPENFNWNGFDQEMFQYRADLTKGDFAVALANALINQGVTTLAIPADDLEEVTPALKAAGLDAILTTVSVAADEAGAVPLSNEETTAGIEADAAENNAAVAEEIAELEAKADADVEDPYLIKEDFAAVDVINDEAEPANDKA